MNYAFKMFTPPILCRGVSTNLAPGLQEYRNANSQVRGCETSLLQ